MVGNGHSSLSDDICDDQTIEPCLEPNLTVVYPFPLPLSTFDLEQVFLRHTMTGTFILTHNYSIAFSGLHANDGPCTKKLTCGNYIEVTLLSRIVLATQGICIHTGQLSLATRNTPTLPCYKVSMQPCKYFQRTREVRRTPAFYTSSGMKDSAKPQHTQANKLSSQFAEQKDLVEPKVGIGSHSFLFSPSFKHYPHIKLPNFTSQLTGSEFIPLPPRCKHLKIKGVEKEANETLDPKAVLTLAPSVAIIYVEWGRERAKVMKV